MSKTKLELNLIGINEMMKSPEIQAHLKAVGDVVAAQAVTISGEDYAAEVHIANFIAISNVYADSEEAARDNSKNNTLLKAVGAVGLPMSKEAAKNL